MRATSGASVDVQELKRRVQTNKRYLRLREAFGTSNIYQMPIDDLIKEVESIHRIRPIRNLNAKDSKFTHKIVDANVVDQSNRSRLVAIQMDCVRASASLQDAVDNMQDYLLLTYSNSLRALRTIDERKMFMRQVLAVFLKYIDRVAVLRDLCTLVIEDIDKGAYSLMRSINAFETFRHRENIV